MSRSEDMEKNDIVLKRGKNLAPSYQSFDFYDFTVGITNYKDPVETGIWHAHENPMISFVLYGANIEFRKGNEINRVNGSVNFYHSHELHKNIYHRFPSKHISIEIDSTYLQNCGYSESEVEYAVKNGYDTPFTFLKLMKEARFCDFQSYDTIKMLLLAFIENSLHTKDETLFPNWMISVRDLLNDKWNENVSLQEIAKKVNVHPTTISKNFKKYFQCTLGEYSRKLKVERARNYLHTTDHSLTEIAYICGFSDQSHFTRTFKSITGFLPKRYSKV